MARAQATDFLQNFRFHVVTIKAAGEVLWEPIGYERTDEGTTGGNTAIKSEAGFQSCSLPDTSMDAVEYREGTYKYTKKFAGVPTIGDVSLMRGVVVKDLAFYNWMVRAVGGSEYRADIGIKQFTRKNVSDPGGTGSIATGAEYAEVPVDCARIYKCYECLPTRSKGGGDLDATSSEVSMGECDFALEYYEIVEEVIA